MNATLPGADVRGFYAALGIELPGWAQTEASVRCFAAPDAHRHGDRDPSCSVNLHSGAFNCHGCGAHGGAYDAALAERLTPREAIDLMIAHGLTERRRGGARGASPARDTSRARGSRQPPLARAGDEPRLAVSAEEVRAWARSLSENGQLLERMRRERGWDPWMLRVLEVGFDGQRVTVPIRDEHGGLQGVLRLRVWDWQRPKVKAALGTRLGVVPRPAPTDDRLVVVEGPSDMLAARSAGLQAVAVPGIDAWRAEWTEAFGERQVTVVMDSDRPGRAAAARIADDLTRAGTHARIVDLAPERDDGYDLSDWLRAGKNPQLLSARSFESEAYQRISHPGGDGWTIRPRYARQTATAPSPGPMPMASGRRVGWPAC